MIRHLLKTETLARPLLVCLAALFLSVFTINIADPDLWGHVRYGADMLRDRQIFRTDPYSYLSGGCPWINHELLCEFTLGYLEPRFGAAGIIAWKCVMGAVMLVGLLWSHRRSPLEPLTVVVISVLLAMSLQYGWVARPQVFTYTFASLLGLMLTQHSRGEARALWFAPPLMIVWTNSHGGFLAGLCVLAVHVAFAWWRQLRERQPGWVRRSLELSLVLLATAAATLVNPYGPQLLRWIWDSLAWPRPEISEWWPVPIFSLEYAAFKTFVAVTVVALLVSRQPRAPSQVAILVLTAIESFLHQRHIPLFAVFAATWVPEHLDDSVQRLRDWAVKRTRFAMADTGSLRMYATGLIVTTLLFAAISVHQATWLKVDQAVYPVSAFRFIHDRGLSGRMVTEFNWGQYCLYAFHPRILVSVDGRFDTSYSREVLDLNLDFIIGDHARWRHRSPSTGPFQADRILDAGYPNLALIDRQRNDCVRTIEQRPDWVLLYQDALAQLWGRRAAYDDPSSPDHLPPVARSITNDTQLGWVAYPALPHSATE